MVSRRYFSIPVGAGGGGTGSWLGTGSPGEARLPSIGGDWTTSAREPATSQRPLDRACAVWTPLGSQVPLIEAAPPPPIDLLINGLSGADGG